MTTTLTFADPTNTTNSWNVPTGVTSLTIKAIGGGGGSYYSSNSNYGLGGGGGYISITYNVNPSDVITIFIGGGGTKTAGGINQFNGSGGSGFTGVGSGGGGSTFVLYSSNISNNYQTLLIAGGGGGGSINGGNGGNGGGNNTFSGTSGVGASGGVGGGAGSTTQYPYIRPNLGTSSTGGGGGGGGWVGGGGGTQNSAGGGGSSYNYNTEAVYSYVDAVNTNNDSTSGPAGAGGDVINGYHPGSNGLVTITYTVGPTPSPPGPTPTPDIIPAISNICFTAGTLIKTDQGQVAIELIDTERHTIDYKPIIAITKTVTLDKFLICIEPHALYKNYPNKTTIMSKDHLISYKRKMMPAYSLLDYSDNVKQMKYNGETLYNVLMAEHTVMDVNNMKCETLHPDNIIAKIYRSQMSDDNKNDIICIMNKALVVRDLDTYKTILTTHF